MSIFVELRQRRFSMIIKHSDSCSFFSFLGICRFCNETGPIRSIAAAADKDLVVAGSQPIVSLLAPVARPDMARRAVSEPGRSLEKPSIVSRRRSHQRNTMTIDTVFENTDELVVQTRMPSGMQPVLITPEVADGFLRPKVFENIPARPRSTPKIYDPVSPIGTQERSSIVPEYGRFTHLL